jgi:DNA-binding NarL/FixJ family response regulator
MNLMLQTCSASGFAVKHVRAHTSCISRHRASRLWIVSRRKSSPHWSRSYPTINMPAMDGLELLGEIKQRCPDLPIMMVSAYRDDERRRRARELGASEFIGCRFILD